MSQQDSTDKPRPEILIIGAGISGLTLAILLEQINIPYHIFERASEVKSLGSVMVFAGNIFPALEQLGIYQELKQVSKPIVDEYFYNADAKKLGTFSFQEYKDSSGYETLIFSRPRFYDILLKRVPAHKISFKKRVLRIEEKEGKTHIHCSDDSSYTGDIVVGADGAHSGVRQAMYKHMDEQSILPKSDLEDFAIGYVNIVGVAKPSNPEKYPQFKEEYSTFNQVVYGDGASANVVANPNNEICWGFGQQLSKTALKEMQIRNAEWGPESSDATLEQYRDFPCPFGGTMGEIIDATPKHLISKVFLEEKIFKTWYHSRSVLVGDACHKLHPAGGQGAGNAIMDAIVLANCLYAMPDSSIKSIKSVFEEYYRQRYHRAETAFEDSISLSKVLAGQNFMERFVRHAVLNYIPSWILDAQLRKLTQYRPQIAWLPQIENRGNGIVLPQEFTESTTTNVVAE
ncbi:hypothetical protein BGX27_011233 [Mortierella sp. AM989]|nr:hypothetical protein BGX27_011233 [Mortierella sp. AM989]